jgi:hypothetical protein
MIHLGGRGSGLTPYMILFRKEDSQTRLTTRRPKRSGCVFIHYGSVLTEENLIDPSPAADFMCCSA